MGLGGSAVVPEVVPGVVPEGVGLPVSSGPANNIIIYIQVPIKKYLSVVYINLQFFT